MILAPHAGRAAGENLRTLDAKWSAPGVGHEPRGDGTSLFAPVKPGGIEYADRASRLTHTGPVDLIERGDAARRHPWELVRGRFFLHLLEEAGLMDPNAAWLDAGAGDAWFARRLLLELGGSARIVCWDVNYTTDDLEAIAAAGVTPTAETPGGAFDRVLLLDVLEHVEDDAAFLQLVVQQRTAADGFVLVSVPAYQALFSSHDAKLRHHRRYSPADCRRLLTDAQLRIVAEGCLFHSLLPVRVAQVVGERMHLLRPGSGGIGGWSRGPHLTRTVARALWLDASVSLRLARRRRIVPGLSYWALCSRAP